MKALFLSAEAVPLAKVGGLADVAGSLPGALRRLGIDVRVVLPFSGSIRSGDWPIASAGEFVFRAGSRSGTVGVHEAATPAGNFTLLSGDPIRPDEPIYGGPPEAEKRRFAFFSRAAVEYCRVSGWKPDVVHAHDFHAAPAVAAVASLRAPSEFFETTGTLLTIHNLAYMGNDSRASLSEFGIEPADPRGILPDWAKESMLGIGIANADLVSTVSPAYAREICTSELGFGLDQALSALGERLSGIINGLDLASWDPATDAALVRPFDASTLDQRAENRAALLSELGLHVAPGSLLLGIVSRFDRQKGLDAAVSALARHAASGGANAIVGSGDRELESEMRTLESSYPGSVRLTAGFNDPLARRVYAGADAFLIPSRYEPCGLTQMIAMRYGAIPIARKTGGLSDTIRDAAGSDGTGFLFETLSPDTVSEAIGRAAAVYARRERWREIQRRAMSEDFSWAKSAEEYAALYRRASAAARAPEER